MDNSYLLKRYAVVTMITIIAIMVLSFLLETFMDHDIGSVGGMISVFVPAMDAGQTYARHQKAKPKGGFAWKMSAIFVAVNMVIGGAFMLVLSLVFGIGTELLAVFTAVGVPGMIIIAVVVCLLSWLVSRFFFGFGAKNELKMQEKLAAKKQP
jgi:hypothetical protein